MDLKKQAKKVITDICTHWICVDEREMNKCLDELSEQFEIIINKEIKHRNRDLTSSIKISDFVEYLYFVEQYQKTDCGKIEREKTLYEVINEYEKCINRTKIEA